MLDPVPPLSVSRTCPAFWPACLLLLRSPVPSQPLPYPQEGTPAKPQRQIERRCKTRTPPRAPRAESRILALPPGVHPTPPPGPRSCSRPPFGPADARRPRPRPWLPGRRRRPHPNGAPREGWTHTRAWRRTPRCPIPFRITQNHPDPPRIDLDGRPSRARQDGGGGGRRAPPHASGNGPKA